MTPSTTTGHAAAAPPTMKPASAAISRPPTSARIDDGIESTGRRARPPPPTTARLVAQHLVVDARCRGRSPSPAARPVSAAMQRRPTAVVLPMPMSPVTRSPWPVGDELVGDVARRRRARRAPRPPSSPGRAARSAVPAPHLAVRRTCVERRHRRATPTSTTSTSAPTWRASTLIAAPPATKLATICAVTSCGHGVTPDATTPWSAANTATAPGVGHRRGHVPAMRRELRAERLEPAERRPAAWSSRVVPSRPRRAARRRRRSGATSGAASAIGPARSRRPRGRRRRSRPRSVATNAGTRGRGRGVAVDVAVADEQRARRARRPSRSSAARTGRGIGLGQPRRRPTSRPPRAASSMPDGHRAARGRRPRHHRGVR